VGCNQSGARRHELENTYLVFDGLDEMATESLGSFAKGLKNLLGSVSPQIAPRRIKLLVTSRLIATLELELSCASISIRSERDVRHFIEGRTEELATRYDIPRHLRHDIVEKLCEKAGGMFLWAVLAWQELCRDAKTPNDFAVNLSKAQQFPPRLEPFYENILDRLPQSARALSLKVFPWLTLAARPLHTNELRFAIAMDRARDMRSMEEVHENMITEAKLRELCLTLISVGGDGHVQFVHSSIKDFFVSPTTSAQYRIDPVATNSNIAMLCLWRLHMPGFDAKAVQMGLCSNRVLKEEDVVNLSVEHDLLPYAAANWHHHAKLAGENLQVWESFRLFLAHHDSVMLWLMLCLDDGSYWSRAGWWEGRLFWEKIAEPPPPVHISVFLNSAYLTAKLVSDGADVNDYCGYWEITDRKYCRPSFPSGGTPLHSEDLDPQLSACLLKLGADMNLPDAAGFTALTRAINNQNEERVLMLLASAKNARRQTSGFGYDPVVLNQAAAMTMVKVVTEILDDPRMDLCHESVLHTDQSALGTYLASPLEHVCLFGMETMARVMISHPRMIAAQRRLEQQRGSRNPTSLAFLTTLQGWSELTLLALQQFEARLDRERDVNDRTILIHAAMEEWHDVLEFCIEHIPRSRLNQQDHNGMTALHHAAKVRNWYATTRLLDAGADYHAENHHGKTPAHVAAESGSDRVLRIMLDKGITESEAVDHDKRTVLHYVATWNLHSIAETLIETSRTQVSMRDKDGRTPLHLAALFGSTAVLTLLLSTRLADVNAQDHSGKTALHCAVESKVESCIDELLSREETDLNMLDRYLKSPLDMTHNFIDEQQRIQIRYLLENAGCHPGMWRSRHGYMKSTKQSAPSPSATFADESCWALVPYEKAPEIKSGSQSQS